MIAGGFTGLLSAGSRQIVIRARSPRVAPSVRRRLAAAFCTSVNSRVGPSALPASARAAVLGGVVANKIALYVGEGRRERQLSSARSGASVGPQRGQ
jgi:hypothetical protein